MKGLSGKRVEIPSMEEIMQERKRLSYRRRYKRVLKSTVYALVVVAAIAVLLATNLLPVLQVSGDSMNPTLQDQDILVLLKTDALEKGDLCGFKYPVQRQSGLGDGTNLLQPQRAVCKLSAKIGILLFQFLLVLFERVDDLYQFHAVHPPQFAFFHGISP